MDVSLGGGEGEGSTLNIQPTTMLRGKNEMREKCRREDRFCSCDTGQRVRPRVQELCVNRVPRWNEGHSTAPSSLNEKCFRF